MPYFVGSVALTAFNCSAFAVFDGTLKFGLQLVDLVKFCGVRHMATQKKSDVVFKSFWPTFDCGFDELGVTNRSFL